MLCSILIPSRGRPDGLLKSIQSVYDTSSDDVDIRIKLDNDDRVTLDRIDEFIRLPRVYIFIGPRLEGYTSLGLFITQLADTSDSKWVMAFNDDAVLVGQWSKQLADVPLEGFIVQPQEYQWGPSVYPGEGTAFPWVPNGFWRSSGYRIIPNPVDAWFHRVLTDQNWKTHYLKGVRAVHNRANEEELRVHRLL